MYTLDRHEDVWSPLTLGVCKQYVNTVVFKDLYMGSENCEKRLLV